MESVQVEKRLCPQCDAPVGEQARFCEQCGAPVRLGGKRACVECGAALNPTARFCAKCGARAGAARRTGVAVRWDHLRRYAAAVDWARVRRFALPLAALLLAGVVGFLIGQRGAPRSQDRIASAERGWRGETPASASRSGVREREAGSAARMKPESLPGGPRDQSLEQASPLTRFRDFHITASSWELAHPPEYAVDGDPYTFWHAWKTERFHNTEWLTFTFPTERVITRIGLLPGRMGPGARAEGRIRSLLVKAAGAPPQKLIFADRPEMQYRFLQRPVRTRKLVLRIGTVLPGRETRHILIPEVQVWGRRIAGPLARRNGE